MGKLVYTQGSFDVFHAGHVNFLRRCANLGELLVALLTDEAYQVYRGYKSINSFDDRYKVISECKSVKRIVPSDNRKTKQEIEKYKPDIVAVSTDWVLPKRNIYKQYHMEPEELDNILVHIPHTQGISSTYVKEKIKEG
jgi:cytidyltransferase-like protein